MSVLMSDEPDHINSVPGPSAHVRRAEGGPNLCGGQGMGFAFEEGEELGGPWPYSKWCPTCRAMHCAETVNAR